MAKTETRWSYDEYHDMWECLTCEEAFQFTCGGVRENRYRYCPHCGREIILCGEGDE